jgi:GDP-4-dehydro-6-deoxy-D-mannose reductase
MRHAARILLTGGSGFVGRYVAPWLAPAFPSAQRVGLLSQRAEALGADWAIVRADIRDEAAIESILADLRPDLIVHLAAQASVGQGLRMAEDTWWVNFGGTFALARAAARHAAQSTFFFSSTAEVYGASFNTGPVNEETPLAPLSAYASSKAAAEHVLRDLLSPTTRLIVTRAFNHTGPGQDERFVLSSFAAQVARIEKRRVPPVIRVGNLEARRDFLDVRDVVEAYGRLIAADDLPERLTVNVASGRVARIGDLLEEMRRLSTGAFEIAVDPARLRASDIPSAVGDASRLKQLTGWSPKETMRSTLRALLDEWRAKLERDAAAQV